MGFSRVAYQGKIGLQNMWWKTVVGSLPMCLLALYKVGFKGSSEAATQVCQLCMVKREGGGTCPIV